MITHTQETLSIEDGKVILSEGLFIQLLSGNDEYRNWVHNLYSNHKQGIIPQVQYVEKFNPDNIDYHG